MIVAFDSSVLGFLFDENLAAPVDPATGMQVVRCKERVHHLLVELQQAKAKIIVPAPSLAEIVVYAPETAAEWIKILSNSKYVRIAPFDVLAAIEYAAIENARVVQRTVRHDGPRRKAKFDEQIVAIATVERCDVIYSDDQDIRKLAGGGMTVRGIADIELPADDPQGSLLDFASIDEDS